MDEIEKIDILKKTIAKYGIRFQLDMCVEECAELIKAINKLKRSHAIQPENGTLGHYPSQQDDVKYSEIYFNLCSEVADVKILIAQLEIILSKEAIDLSEERKLARLKTKNNF